MRLRYLASLCCFLPQALSLDYFNDIGDLAKEPTLLTGDIGEHRIEVDGETYAKWQRVVDNNELVEVFFSFYRGAEEEWESLFYGSPRQEPYDYHIRSTCYTEKVNRVKEAIFDTYKIASKGKDPPIEFQNKVVEWANTLFEIVISTWENPFYNVATLDLGNVPAEYSYTVDMLNRDFPEDYRDSAKFEDEPIVRTTADHLHLLFTPRFKGPRYPNNRYGSHIQSRSEQIEKYLLNAEEVSAKPGVDIRKHEFKFVVSKIDVSLEHQLVTVVVDLNKTTRVWKTLLKLRDRLLEIRKQGLVQAWDIRLAMGKYDSRVAGWNKTMEEQEKAAEERARIAEEKKGTRSRFANFWHSFEDTGEAQRMSFFPKKQQTPIFQKWQLLKDLVRQVTLIPEHLIDDLAVMAEILRVMEVPQLPRIENSAHLGKDLTFNAVEAPKYMRLSDIETMASPMNQNTSPINQNTSPGGLLLRLEEQDNRDPTFREERGGSGLEPTDRTDRAFEDLINAIPISIDLRESDGDSESQQGVQLVREGSDPTNADQLKLLSTDVSPSARSLLHPGTRTYSPPRRSIFSGTGSRFSDAVNDAGKNN
ncbi:hypothetical protein TWF102_010581 [Orbilia oligospora]|uniref:Uncharacterized protein n=1 Tax=Orbilia oligospora TaxID=2813651 RepID=A0A7C8NAK8_ORBOL|nr:hypothetical protein TWF102_010581 [Orbilia oligospora]